MSEVIFCQTDYYRNGGYASYRDLYRLIELAGYPIIPVSQIDTQSDNVYIYTPSNGETINGWENPKCQIILWQLEWMLTNEHDTPRGVSRVWCSDAHFAKVHNFEYVPMGSDERLNETKGMAVAALYDYHVAQISYQTPRRQSITQQLIGEGLRVAPCENLWGIERSSVLSFCKTMLHVHQHDNAPGIAPLRWCLAAAHHLPMISETVNDRGIFGYTHMVTADYAHLAEFTAHMLKDERLLADYAAALNDLLCHQLTFRKSIEAAL